MTKDRPCTSCPALIYRDNKTGLCVTCLKAQRRATPQAASPAEALDADRQKRKTADDLAQTKALYKESLKVIEKQDAQIRAINVLKQGREAFTIAPKQGKRTSEGTAVIVASDWHVEERVGAEVGGLNTYTLDIATARATKFFQSALRLVKLLQQDITIQNIVLALLGDFITNDIHEGENAENNQLTPMHAITLAQNLLISGIDFLLANTAATFVVPCHSGNHARTTHKTRFTTENGHSLEYLMYLHLAAYYRNEPRITFIIPEGMHSYVQVYDTTIRFHHGHAVKYGGGVGGIYIPVNKAISQWSKARHADLDVFGHFHQMRDGGNFLCNGSLIGYNAFALSIKADYEQPKQLLFLIDKKRGRTCTWPILVNQE